MGRVPPYRLLDLLRALAAVWVLMLHAGQRVDANLNPGLAHGLVSRIGAAGQLGVAVFFVISGYCITAACYSSLASQKTVRRFAFERARRIYPPYLAASLLSLVVRQLLIASQTHHLLPPIHHTIQGFPHTALFWVANLLMIQPETRQWMLIVVAWSLAYEAVYYVVLGSLLALAKWRERRHGQVSGLLWFSAGVGILTALSLLWMIVSPQTCPVMLDRWYQFGLGALFYLAVELTPARMPSASARPRSFNCVQMAATLTLTSIFAALRAFRTPGMEVQPSSRPQAITCMVLLAMLYFLRPVDHRIGSLKIMAPLFWVGSFSYSIYLVHLIFLEIFDTVLKRAHLNGGLYWVAYLLNMVLCLFVSWLFYQAVEKHFISSRQKKRLRSEVGAAVLV